MRPPTADAGQPERPGRLRFGPNNGCDGYGLGQDPPANVGGCRSDIPFLQEEIGPPSKSFGCCTATGGAGSLDQIGSLPGNKVSADCSYWIDNEVTECRGGKDITGVWRKAIFQGPVGSTPTNPLVPQPLGVQLLK